MKEIITELVSLRREFISALLITSLLLGCSNEQIDKNAISKEAVREAESEVLSLIEQIKFQSDKEFTPPNYSFYFSGEIFNAVFDKLLKECKGAYSSCGSTLILEEHNRIKKLISENDEQFVKQFNLSVSERKPIYEELKGRGDEWVFKLSLDYWATFLPVKAKVSYQPVGTYASCYISETIKDRPCDEESKKEYTKREYIEMDQVILAPRIYSESTKPFKFENTHHSVTIWHKSREEEITKQSLIKEFIKGKPEFINLSRHCKRLWCTSEATDDDFKFAMDRVEPNGYTISNLKVSNIEIY